MQSSVKLARLKGELSAHRKAVNALTTATLRLHRTLDGILGAVAERPSPPRNWTSKEPRPKRSGDIVSKPASNDTGKRSSPRSRDTDSDIDRARAAALERHWGNLF